MAAKEAVLVTGCAGFIGYHFTRRLLDEGYEVIGADNLNPYYDSELKQARLRRLEDNAGAPGTFRFHRMDLSAGEAVEALFESARPSRVVHLAAQAGVRHSLEQPHAYVKSNIEAFLHILEGCRKHEVRHLLYASSSSVYGANRTVPFSVEHRTDHPVSLYAATKKSNELMAHAYSHLFRIPMTGLRFFTVYGPWGRPDMAYYLFTQAILENRPIRVFNHGKLKRDFTYIDDAVEAVFRLLPLSPNPGPEHPNHPDQSVESAAQHHIYNIGNRQPVELMDFIAELEKQLGRPARLQFEPMQPGDVAETSSDIASLIETTGYEPRTSVQEGLERFVRWYRDFYRV